MLLGVYLHLMTKRVTKRANFLVDAALLRQMREFRKRTGMAASEQVRRALASWFKRPSVDAKPEQENPNAD